ncbi:MAG: type II toxin-antitoxin system VapC family toxin [Actinobacteria bacterium]|nr:type II toxin-antitoxin system VapC family toxin [Actinomycetota bacterium]
MTVVIDAGLVVATALPLPCSDEARSRIRLWTETGEVLLAPYLMAYEVATACRKAVAASWLTADRAADALDDALSLNIHWVEPSPDLGRRALAWAARIGQKAAYDAAYLALAESAGVELWTTDRRLARAGRQAGVDWIRPVPE